MSSNLFLFFIYLNNGKLVNIFKMCVMESPYADIVYLLLETSVLSETTITVYGSQ